MKAFITLILVAILYVILGTIIVSMLIIGNESYSQELPDLNKYHDHSLYDATCCSGQDCEPIEPENIKEVQGGYEVDYWSNQKQAQVHAFFEYGRVKPSKDFRPHACATKCKPQAYAACSVEWIPHCLYLPYNV